MANLVYRSPIWAIYWHPQARCLQFVFTEQTRFMGNDEYIRELITYIDLVKKYEPQSIYADTREFYFTIVPEVQKFTNNNILSLYEKVGLRKHAVLVSKDIFTAVSVEMTMEERPDAAYQNRYFDNPEELEKWLNL